MENTTSHDYLITLIKELEKSEDKTDLDNFIIVMEDILKVKYRLRNYLDYPISENEYQELITYAENLLGVNRFGSKDDPHYEHLEGVRYDDATPKIETYSRFFINGREVGAYHYNEQDKHYEFCDNNNEVIATIESEKIIAFKVHGNEEWNHLAYLFGEVDQDLVKYALEYYTPDQLTFDLLDADNNINDATKKAIKEALLKKREEYDEDSLELNEETIAALEEAANEEPKNLKTYDEVKNELFGDKSDPNYEKYWGKDQEAHFFYANDYIDAWKCADIWHKEIYYWPYNEQYIVGQINPVEWYKTKGDEQQWGPIFGPFASPEELNKWVPEFWKWWHALNDKTKSLYHNIPVLDNVWYIWSTNYEGMLERYKGKDSWDYNKIAAEAQNDDYSKMTEEEFLERYYNKLPEAFTKEWDEKVADLVGQIKMMESNLEENYEFDGETIQELENKLLNLLKQTL